MPQYAQTLTHLFALGIVFLQVVLVLSFLYRVSMGRWLPVGLAPFMQRCGLWFAATIAIASLVISLWYSEIVGLLPCTLCWFIRTMMYPLAFILPIAAWRRDAEVWRYVLPLTAVGTLIGGYQHLLQMGTVSGSVCHALSGTVDCAKRYIFEFGYITFPLLGFTACVAIAWLVWVTRAREQQ
jgi:disulfide bond formation protein DsbB